MDVRRLYWRIRGDWIPPSFLSVLENYGLKSSLSSPIWGRRGASGSSRQGARHRAVKARVEDLREEFVRDFVFPAFRANSVYEGPIPAGTSIARPLIANSR